MFAMGKRKPDRGTAAGMKYRNIVSKPAAGSG
jgi:hypothetical protein